MEKEYEKIIELEKCIFDRYTLLKIADMKQDTKKYHEIVDELQTIITLEDYEINKLSLNHSQIRKIKQQLMKQFKFINNDIAVNNILQNSFDTKGSYSLDFFSYDFYTVLKLIYIRLYQKLEYLEISHPKASERESNEYYEEPLMSQIELEELTGVYVDEYPNSYFEYSEYLIYAVERNPILAFRPHLKESLDRQVEADLYLKYITVLENNKNGSDFDFLLVDRIYNLSFIDNLIERELINCHFSISEIKNNPYTRKEKNANLRYMKMMTKRISLENLNRILNEIDSNHDIDLGINDGVFDSKEKYHKNNYYLVILKSLLLKTCAISVENEMLNKILKNFEFINKYDIEDKQAIFHLIENSLTANAEDQKQLRLK